MFRWKLSAVKKQLFQTQMVTTPCLFSSPCIKKCFFQKNLSSSPSHLPQECPTGPGWLWGCSCLPVAICRFSAPGTVCLNPVAEVLGEKTPKNSKEAWGTAPRCGRHDGGAGGRGGAASAADWLAARRGT